MKGLVVGLIVVAIYLTVFRKHLERRLRTREEGEGDE